MLDLKGTVIKHNKNIILLYFKLFMVNKKWFNNYDLIKPMIILIGQYSYKVYIYLLKYILILYRFANETSQ